MTNEKKTQNNKKQAPADAQVNPKPDEITVLKDQVLRAQADLDNFRKRSALERESTIKFANTELIMQLLPVLDNFKRAAAHAPKTDDKATQNWVLGIQAIERQFEEALKESGVVAIETIPGHRFDTTIHEAISHEPSDQPEDTIIEITETGYILNNKVLRPAKVRVSSGKN